MGFGGDPCVWGTTLPLIAAQWYELKYAVLAWGPCCAHVKVIADKDDEGPIGVVDTAIATSSSLDKAHPLQELSRPPQWWSKSCLGDRCVQFVAVGRSPRLFVVYAKPPRTCIRQELYLPTPPGGAEALQIASKYTR